MTPEFKEILNKKFRDIPDFPKPGILFKDITPVLFDPYICDAIIEDIYWTYHFGGITINAIVALESRGFFFGFALAQRFKVPFIPLRKPGKLPGKVISVEYAKEYGTDKIEMSADTTLGEFYNVLIHDDLLATGGTAEAAGKLIQSTGANVAGFSFISSIKSLKGEEKLRPLLTAEKSKIYSILEF